VHLRKNRAMQIKVRLQFFSKIKQMDKDGHDPLLLDGFPAPSHSLCQPEDGSLLCASVTRLLVEIAEDHVRPCPFI
jgi:hypothetical protein